MYLFVCRLHDRIHTMNDRVKSRVKGSVLLNWRAKSNQKTEVDWKGPQLLLILCSVLLVHQTLDCTWAFFLSYYECSNEMNHFPPLCMRVQALCRYLSSSCQVCSMLNLLFHPPSWIWFISMTSSEWLWADSWKHFSSLGSCKWKQPVYKHSLKW